MNRIRIPVFLLLIALSSMAMAGFDGWFVVSKVDGDVQVRELHPIPGRPGWTQWRKVKVGDRINPPSEVRTGAKSRVWLQSGDQLRHVDKLRSDERVDTHELGPNTLVRTNGQRLNGPKIFIVERGQVTEHHDHGKGRDKR